MAIKLSVILEGLSGKAAEVIEKAVKKSKKKAKAKPKRKFVFTAARKAALAKARKARK